MQASRCGTARTYPTFTAASVFKILIGGNMSMRNFVIIAIAAALLFFTGCNPGNNEETDPVDPGYTGITFEPISDPADLKITEVFDNVPFDLRLGNEWGFSALVEYGDRTLLFDTGSNGTLLLENMQILGIDPQTIEVIVLSHIHDDHVNGLQSLLDLGITPVVYVPESFPTSFKDNVRNYTQLVEVDAAVEIFHGVYSSGQLTTGTPYEQGLIVSSREGLVFITGCAHPNIDLMVERVGELIQEDIFLVMGGFHLMDSGDSRVRDVIAGMRENGVLRMMPVHCTGDTAVGIFRTQLGGDFYEGGAGRIIEITD
jgi:7,8-dihydropterin-6-yl-methyl-4-(beta-D-ribofuranosyl)aminobenzene 5'-phosphate synthase